MHPIVDEITHRFVTVYNPRLIYLNASTAWGDPKSDSDLDLLVLTHAEFEKRIKDHSSLFHEIHDKGILLYETA